jgi:periplasmic divalent cation tolerance protein
LPEEAGVIVVVTTLPDRRAAIALATSLVSERIAACVNVLGECTSVYRWQGKVEKAFEVPVLIKAPASRYPRLEAAIRAQHPYELPEILVFPVAGGFPAYLDWVTAEAAGTDPA